MAKATTTQNITMTVWPFINLKLTEQGNVYGEERAKSVEDIASQLRADGDLMKLPALDINEKGEILAGHRRYAAIQQYVNVHGNDAVEVPVKVHAGLDRKGEVAVAVGENERRKNATPYQTLKAFAAALAAGYTPKEAREQLFVTVEGKPQTPAWQSHVGKVLEAFSLSPAFEKAFSKTELGIRAGYDIVSTLGVKKGTKKLDVDLLNKLAADLKENAPELLSRVGRMNTVSAARKANPADGSEGEGEGGEGNEGGKAEKPDKPEYISSAKLIKLLESVDEFLRAEIKAGNKPDAYGAALEAFKPFDKLVTQCLQGKMDTKKLVKKFMPASAVGTEE